MSYFITYPTEEICSFFKKSSSKYERVKFFSYASPRSRSWMFAIYSNVFTDRAVRGSLKAASSLLQTNLEGSFKINLNYIVTNSVCCKTSFLKLGYDKLFLPRT